MAGRGLKWNSGFFDQLGDSGALYGVTERVAHQIAAQARSTAPVKSGDYRGSIHVEEAPRPGRRVALVVADHPGAIGIESRTGNLARAITGGT